MDTEPTNSDNEIGALIEQLQTHNSLAQKTAEEKDPLKKEEMETFIIEKTGELVNESLEFMKVMKDFIACAPNGESITSIANLINATSSALETLNKLVITDKKIDTSVKIKEMDIKTRKEIAESDNSTKVMITREEVFKRLIVPRENTTTVIDVSAD